MVRISLANLFNGYTSSLRITYPTTICENIYAFLSHLPLEDSKLKLEKVETTACGSIRNGISEDDQIDW